MDKKKGVEMIKACVFDLDGTLADTLESMAYIANEIMRGFHLKEQPAEKFKYYCGEGATMLMQRCLSDSGDTELVHLEEGQKMYRERFAENPMYKVKAYEGIPEVLQKLKDRGIQLGVCSNKPHPATVKVMETMFPGLFEMVLGQSDAVARKPAPDGALKIAETFGVKPEECMYIGDTMTDMLTGKAAGMFTVGVLWGFRDREELEKNGADVIIEHPLDLLKLCEEK